MTCDLVQPELVAYHFNVLEDDARRGVEEHLVGCPACVRRLVALKRSIETSDDVPWPSKGSRRALRDAVASELGVADVPWSWWQRPLALALAASVVLAAGTTTRALMSVPGSAPYASAARGPAR